MYMNRKLRVLPFPLASPISINSGIAGPGVVGGGRPPGGSVVVPSVGNEAGLHGTGGYIVRSKLS